jgi:hypothetical protein
MMLRGRIGDDASSYRQLHSENLVFFQGRDLVAKLELKRNTSVVLQIELNFLFRMSRGQSGEKNQSEAGRESSTNFHSTSSSVMQRRDDPRGACDIAARDVTLTGKVGLAHRLVLLCVGWAMR